MRRALTLLAALALLALVAQAAQVRPRFSFEDFLPVGDATAAEDQRLRALFDVDGRRELYLAASRGAHTLDADALRALGQVLRGLQTAPWLAALHSPFTTPRVELADEVLQTRVPLAAIPDDAAGRERLREELGREVLPGLRWLSRDGQGLLAILELRPEAVQDLQQATRIVDAVEAALAPLAADGWRLHLAGVAAMEARSTRFLAREAGLFFVVTLAIMALVLWWSFGQARLTLGALGLGLAAVAVQLGVLGALGLPLTLLTLASPVVVLVVVLCDLIHVVSDQLRLRAEGVPAATAQRQALQRGYLTCLWTSVTSAVGFACFAVTTIPVIRQFAVATSLGILGGYAVAMLGLPALLGVARTPGADRWLERGLTALVARCRVAVAVAPRAILAGCLLLLVVSAGLAARLRVDSRLLEELADHHPVVVDNRYFAGQFLGESRIDLVLGLAGRGDALDGEGARLLDALARAAAAEPAVHSSHSALSLLAWVDRLLGGDGALASADAARLAQLSLLAEQAAPGLLERYLARGDDGRQQLRLELRFGDPGAAATLALLDRLVARARAVAPDVTVGLAGRTYATMRAYHLLTTQALWSFVFSIAAIGLLMVLAFGSLRLGLLAMLPNLLPLVAVLGLYAALGVTLKPSSMLFFSVALGFAVDNTLHGVRRLRALRGALAWPAAADAALAQVGPAMLRSALVVGLGFAVLLASSSRAIAMLGLTVLLTTVMALAADLLMVPAGAVALGAVRPALRER